MESSKLTEQVNMLHGTLQRIERLLEQVVTRLGYIELHCADVSRRTANPHVERPRPGGAA